MGTVKVGTAFPAMNVKKCNNGHEYRALAEQIATQDPHCAHHPHCDCILEVSEEEISKFDCYLHLHFHPNIFFNPKKIWDDCQVGGEIAIARKSDYEIRQECKERQGEGCDDMVVYGDGKG